jgi:hypothetical protein
MRQLYFDLLFDFYECYSMPWRDGYLMLRPLFHRAILLFGLILVGVAVSAVLGHAMIAGTISPRGFAFAELGLMIAIAPF